nr:S-layer homology domain-containing protein [uncultured Dysosmobacter sp.]
MKRMMMTGCALALAGALLAAPAAAYRDIPETSPLASEVELAVNHGLMNGYDEETFGYGDAMTRAQFVTVLCRMLLPETERETGHITPAMQVPQGSAQAYYASIDAAAELGWVDTDVPFRPGAAITRGEMAEILVRALGLESAASARNSNSMIPSSGVTAFQDLPAGKEGYISVAYDIGLTKGTSATTFSPGATATRAQAAAMLERIYEKLHRKTEFSHGFYAISSYSQMDLAEELDAVSAGWSRMTWDGERALLATTSAHGNEFSVPAGYQEVAETLAGKGVSLNLSVFMDGKDLGALLSSKQGRAQAVEQIANELTVSYKALGRNPYAGVTIDFEGLGRSSAADFSAFLTELSRQVRDLDKTLYVCVPPPSSAGGYDLKTIGALADKVILMAHDYDARSLSGYVGSDAHQDQATVPLGRVYQALRTTVEQVDPAKVVLALSARNVAWEIDGAGKLVSSQPVAVSGDTVARRLSQPDTKRGWDPEAQQSWASYTTEEGKRYFLWYQDGESVRLELQTARLLDVTGVSLWRLGTIPQYENWTWSASIK